MNIHSADIPSAKTVPAPGQPKVNAEEIKFATGKSKFGIVLVARSARGQRDRPGAIPCHRVVTSDGALVG